MKRIILCLSALLFVSHLMGQQIKLSIGPTYNYALQNKEVHFGTSETPLLIGINTNLDYVFQSKKQFQFGLGFGYNFSKIPVYRGSESLADFQSHVDKIQLFSLRFHSIYNFKNNFYIDFDPVVELQMGYDSQQYLDKQNGLGLSTGIGKEFLITDYLSLTIEPRFWLHNLIPFQTAVPTRFTTYGIVFGIGFGHRNNKNN